MDRTGERRRDPRSGGAPRRLVVLLHGVGADADDLIDLAAEWATAAPDALFLSLDAPDPYAEAPFGRQWFPLSDRRPAVLAAAIRAAAPALEARLAAILAREGLPDSALTLMGFSQGAMMALHAGLRRAVPPAGILAYAGALLDPATLAAEATRPLPPVLLVHGLADEVVPAQASQLAEAALRGLGAAVEARFIPGLGHGIDAAGLAAGAAFLARRVTPA
ncbi:prolyl oligopeptidase family serine peptidase [Roseomonas sp. OT10]|uniref:alpha/beta hydrolase n=1 Tax=Roseomonas cutis TaxID=2897332 RepID=UPI001E4D7FCD|nr:prolyl oligopeptidase family serine peptidase [Roseomonas sp. OT10]UFN50163.1 prolyl oligopeptidase family serine peptidase [Roseomonas sp. OT10]